jgi:alpha-tubulin suppressor-like RCC1 family protein/serine/threonine protein kinase
MMKYEDKNYACPHCGYVEESKAEDSLHMIPGSILRERYIVGKVLGFGNFGITYIGWDATLEQKVAIKEYLPSEFSTRVPGQANVTVFTGDKAEQFGDGLSKFVEEAQRLAKFHQEDGVVRIFDSFEENNTAYIIREYLQGESLEARLRREKTMPVDDAIKLLMPIIKSLEVIHRHGIIHRFIAPDNIFLSTDGRVKLIDFGAARFATTSHSRSLTVIIKPGYSPEEQYRSLGDQGSHTDVYAIGATLYRMVTGIVPPDAFERRAYFEGKKKDILKPIAKFAKDISENQETAILNAINVRIEDRTQNMSALAKELTTKPPEKVTRLYGKISKLPLYNLPLWAKIGFPAAMFVIITLGIFRAFAPSEILPPLINDGQTRVPSVISNDIAQAEERLRDAELSFLIVGRDSSDRIPENLVLSQSINAGDVVAVNTTVEVRISEGAEPTPEGEIPDLVYLTLDDARRVLVEMGMNIGVDYAASENTAIGLVISQNPAAGASSVDVTMVSVVISTGQPRSDDDVIEDEETTEPTGEPEPPEPTIAPTSSPAAVTTPAPEPTPEPTIAPTTAPTPSPQPVSNERMTVAAAGSHTGYVISSSGALWAWGSNSSGQIGDGTTVNRFNPVRISGVYTAVSGGSSHTMAIRNDNSLWAWGGAGRLGDGTANGQLSPIRIMDNVVAVSAGNFHTAAITNDRNLWAWGHNNNGQLGDGTTVARHSPVRIIADVSAVSVGESHTMAITSDGNLWAWGWNEHGQLGNGSNRNVNEPTFIMENVRAVSAGNHHSMVIRTDGSLWSWGRNGSGQLGRGSTSARQNRPEKILDDVLTVSAGFNHTVAIRADRSLWAWGANDRGQLGDGTNTNQSSPVRIMDNVAHVSAGHSFTIAIKTDGTVWAWGHNVEGQLGDSGNASSRNSPVQIFVD